MWGANKPQGTKERQMTSIPQVCQAMQTVLTTIADQAGQKSDFIVRNVKVRGSTFVQTLVFGFLTNPHATGEALAQTAAVLGLQISSQGLEQRVTETAAACFEHVLAAAVRQVIAAAPVALPVLDRFPAVEIQDSTTISLPPELATVFFGAREGSASLKVHLGLDLRTGALRGLSISDGFVHECTISLPAGSLLLADLGYFAFERFRALRKDGQFWLSRDKTGTIVRDADGR